MSNVSILEFRKYNKMKIPTQYRACKVVGNTTTTTNPAPTSLRNKFIPHNAN